MHDSRVLETLLDKTNTSKDVFADGAYRSAEAKKDSWPREAFAAASASRHTAGRPLSKAEAAANRAASRIRARMEHVFGTQEPAPGHHVLRTIGTLQKHLKIGLPKPCLRHPPTGDAGRDQPEPEREDSVAASGDRR